MLANTFFRIVRVPDGKSAVIAELAGWEGSFCTLWFKASAVRPVEIFWGCFRKGKSSLFQMEKGPRHN
jgi:hypothetical protein